MPRRDFDGVVDANEAHAFFHEGVELVQVFHQRMALSAVGKHDHAGRVVEDVRILRPALHDDRVHLRHILVEVAGQQQAAGVVLVLSVAVARVSGDEHDFLLLAGRFRGAGGRAGDLLELDVLELHLHHVAGVKLQCDDPRVAAHGRVLVVALAGEDAVDPLLHVIAAAGDVVGVPVFVLDVLEDLVRVADRADDFHFAVRLDDRSSDPRGARIVLWNFSP